MAPTFQLDPIVSGLTRPRVPSAPSVIQTPVRGNNMNGNNEDGLVTIFVDRRQVTIDANGRRSERANPPMSSSMIGRTIIHELVIHADNYQSMRLAADGSARLERDPRDTPPNDALRDRIRYQWYPRF